MNSPIKVYYNTGSLRYEVETFNGKWNGLYKEYYQNGKLMKELTYLDGIKNGICKIYLLSGCYSILNFVNGYIEGECLDYNSEGQIIRRSNHKKGIKHGSFIEYDTVGKVRLELNYKYGFKHGKQIQMETLELPNNIIGYLIESVYLDGEKQCEECGYWMKSDGSLEQI